MIFSGYPTGQPLHTYEVDLFFIFKILRSTPRKALKLFWFNAQHSEVFKMVRYGLLARLDFAQSRLKVTKNFLFSAKIAENKPFLLKKANSSELWDDFAG